MTASSAAFWCKDFRTCFPLVEFGAGSGRVKFQSIYTYCGFFVDRYFIRRADENSSVVDVFGEDVVIRANSVEKRLEICRADGNVYLRRVRKHGEKIRIYARDPKYCDKYITVRAIKKLQIVLRVRFGDKEKDLYADHGEAIHTPAGRVFVALKRLDYRQAMFGLVSGDCEIAPVVKNKHDANVRREIKKIALPLDFSNFL